MASTKIRGITIELDADTSGISRALKEVNTEIGSTSRQLKDVERLLKLDPGNVELLEQKQRLLNDRIGETKTKLDTLKTAQKQVGEEFEKTGKGKEQYDALTREIISCENELKDLEKAAKQSNTALQKIATTGEKLKDLGKTISNIGDNMTRYITTPIVGAGTAIVKVAGDFEEQMAKVSAISGAYGDELEALRKNAMDLSETSQFSAYEIAQAYEYMGMAGWDANQILAGTPGIIDLATASGEDLATVSDIVTDGLTAFGLTAEDTGRFVNALAEASRSSNTNVSLMGESFKYAANVMGPMGYSAEDTAIALGLMANSGIKASMAGTTLRNMFQRMAKPTKETASAMGRLGLELYDETGRMYSMKEIMDNLRKGFSEINMPLEDYNKRLDELDAALEEGNITQKNYDAELEELNLRAFGAEGAEKARAAAMLGGARAMSGLMAIASATEEDYNNLTDAIYGSSEAMVRTSEGAVMPMSQALAEGKDVIAEYEGTAAAMAGVMNDTTNVALKQTKNELENLAIDLGETLLPIVRDVLVIINEWVQAFRELSPETQEMIVKAALIVAAIGPILSVGGRLISGIGSLLTLVPKLGTVFSSLGTILTFIAANPIVLLVAAIVGLVALIAVKGDEIQAKLQDLDDFLTDKFTKDWRDTFGPKLGGIMNGFSVMFAAPWQKVKDILNGIIDFIRGVFTGDWERAWNGVTAIFGSIFDRLVNLAKSPINGIIALLNMAIDGINALINGLNSMYFEIPDWLGGGSFGFNVPTIPGIPYLAKGGKLSNGSAIVGEAGAELLTVSNGQATVTPLTNNTTNTIGATTINVYGAPGQDVNELANIISEKIAFNTARIQNAW